MLGKLRKHRHEKTEVSWPLEGRQQTPEHILHHHCPLPGDPPVWVRSSLSSWSLHFCSKRSLECCEEGRADDPDRRWPFYLTGRLAQLHLCWFRDVAHCRMALGCPLRRFALHEQLLRQLCGWPSLPQGVEKQTKPKSSAGLVPTGRAAWCCVAVLLSAAFPGTGQT